MDQICDHLISKSLLQTQPELCTEHSRQDQIPEEERDDETDIIS